MASLTRASIALAICALVACGEDASEPNPGDETGDPCATSTADYQTVGQPFMMTWCTPCHHAEFSGEDRPLGSESVDLDRYEDVLEHLDRIEARALSETPTMPPGGGPSDSDLERLGEWISCGAPE